MFGLFRVNNDHSEEEQEHEEDLSSRRAEIQAKLERLWVRLRKVLTLKNLVNTSFILTVCIICLQQCYSQIVEYRKFSVRLQVSHGLPDSPLWLMPGLTICNKNRIRLDTLAERDPSLATKLDQLWVNRSFASSHDEAQMVRRVRQLVDESLNRSKMNWNSSMSSMYKLSEGHFIKDINCNFLWGPQYNCENLRIIDSYQDGFCNTIFSYQAMMEAVSSGLLLDTKTSLLGGQRKTSPFEDHELVEVILDFEPSQQADLERDLGGKLIVHATNHVGSVRDTSHEIRPGHSYDMVLRRSRVERLPPPYKTMCRDYRAENQAALIGKSNSSRHRGSLLLDKTSCKRSCSLAQTIEQCRCWPLDVPYFEGDHSVVSEGADLPQCSSRAGPEARCRQMWRNMETLCENECRLSCIGEEYRRTMVQSEWPTREDFVLAQFESADKVEELHRLRRCCAKLSVKYFEFIETRLQMQPSTSLTQLVANIGGIVSALVGVSAVTLYRFLTRKLLRLGVSRSQLNRPALRWPAI